MRNGLQENLAGGVQGMQENAGGAAGLRGRGSGCQGEGVRVRGSGAVVVGEVFKIALFAEENENVTLHEDEVRFGCADDGLIGRI